MKPKTAKHNNTTRPNNIPPASRLPTEAIAAFVGLDWGDTLHFGALLPAGTDEVESFTIPQTPEAIDQWATELRRRFGGRPVAVCLLQSRGPLIYALLRPAFAVLAAISTSSGGDIALL